MRRAVLFHRENLSVPGRPLILLYVGSSGQGVQQFFFKSVTLLGSVETILQGEKGEFETIRGGKNTTLGFSNPLT